MTRTTAVIFAGAFSAMAMVTTSLVAGQARPEGAPPLQKYHIHPGDLPSPATGTANPPMVVDRPAGASLNLPPGFKIEDRKSVV